MAKVWRGFIQQQIPGRPITPNKDILGAAHKSTENAFTFARAINPFNPALFFHHPFVTNWQVAATGKFNGSSLETSSNIDNKPLSVLARLLVH